jgi:hypothetical protein
MCVNGDSTDAQPEEDEGMGKNPEMGGKGGTAPRFQSLIQISLMSNAEFFIID